MLRAAACGVCNFGDFVLARVWVDVGWFLLVLDGFGILSRISGVG